MAKKGLKNALLSIYEEWRGVEDGLKVFKAANLVRCVVLQSVNAQWVTIYMSSSSSFREVSAAFLLHTVPNKILVFVLNNPITRVSSNLPTLLEIEENKGGRGGDC